MLLAEKAGRMPTDTIYGLHCIASSSAAIKKIYDIKHRPEQMPYITLVIGVAELVKFDVVLNEFALH